MTVIEITEDKFGKAMKCISKIAEHAECLEAMFTELAEDSEYGNRYGERRKYDDGDMYDSRYGMRRGGRRY